MGDCQSPFLRAWILLVRHSEEMTYRNLDFSAWLQWLNEERILGWFYHSIPWQRHGLTIIQIEELKQSIQLAKRRALLQSAWVHKISNTFLEKDIRCLFFKGVVLSQLLYGDVAVRQSADIDVLVSVDSLVICHEILKTLDFALDPRCKVLDFDSRQLYKVRRWVRDIWYVHKTTGIHLELHVRLHTNPYLIQASFEELWQRRQKVHLQCGPVYGLSWMDNCVYLPLHAMRSAWDRLQFLQDLITLLPFSHGVDWEHFLRRIQNAPAALTCAINFELVNRIDPARLPDSLKLWLNRYPHLPRLADKAFYFLNNSRSVSNFNRLSFSMRALPFSMLLLELKSLFEIYLAHYVLERPNWFSVKRAWFGYWGFGLILIFRFFKNK